MAAKLIFSEINKIHEVLTKTKEVHSLTLEWQRQQKKTLASLY